MAERTIRRFRDCISDEERKQKLGLTVVNLLLWLVILGVVIGTMGVALIFIIPGWLISLIFGEYFVRKIQALGATVGPNQFPEVHEAMNDICERFEVPNKFRVVIVDSGDANAMAINIARKHVTLILSELLEGIIDDPAQLRMVLAHETCHQVLDHGSRKYFELYKPAKFKAARELTCDNAGLVAAGDLEASRAVIRKIAVGKRLHDRIDDEALKAESKEIYSGITGWLLRQYLTYPPAGDRMRNLETFAAKHPEIQRHERAAELSGATRPVTA